MTSDTWWLRLVLACFPRDFRDRQAADLLDTLDDLLDATPPAERAKVRRRAFLDLVRAGFAERLAGLTRPTPRSRHARSSLMDDWMHDLRAAFRSLTRRPTFAIMVIATLAVALGASAAMFGVVHGVLLEPLPYDQPDRLVTMVRHFTNDPAREDDTMSLPDLRDVQSEIASLDAVAGYGRGRQTLMQDGRAQLIATSRVTDGLFEVFGLAPSLGRDLKAADAEPGAPRAVVLGHGFWRSRFAADPEILGRQLEISGQEFTVVGVGPEGFDFPEEVEMWVPWRIEIDDCGRGCHMMSSIGRLSADASMSLANQELVALGVALEAEYPDDNTYKRFAVRQVQEMEVAPVRSALWLLLGAVQLVVLIAAVNVANLVLVRGERRRRELAIRTAIGAGRGRLFRQLMMENGLLALAGAMAGILVGQACLLVFLRIAPPDLPRLDAVGLDTPVFAFTAVISMVVLLLFGLAPAMRMANTELRSRGNVGSRESSRTRSALLTAEVALALMLLLGAGLLLRSVVQISEIDLGFSPERVSRFGFALPGANYPEPLDAVRFSERLEAELGAAPGVEAVGLALAGPFGQNRISSSIEPLDRPEPPPGDELGARMDVVSAGFFEALQIKPLRGRIFNADDTVDSPYVLVISQTLAERYFPDKDPIGVRARVGLSFGLDEDDQEYTIIGVVPDIRAYSLTETPEPAVYMPQSQTGSPFLSALVRARPGVDATSIARSVFASLDPSLPMRSADSQAEAIDAAYGTQRFYLALLTGFAGVALFLSAIGLYGVVAFLVSQRTRELAVRIALGADAGRVLRLVLGDALKPTALGITVGLLGAWATARVLDSLLYGVTAHDAVTFAAAPLILLAVAISASMVPALRAARLDPRIALEDDP